MNWEFRRNNMWALYFILFLFWFFFLQTAAMQDQRRSERRGCMFVVWLWLPVVSGGTASCRCLFFFCNKELSKRCFPVYSIATTHPHTHFFFYFRQFLSYNYTAMYDIKAPILRNIPYFFYQCNVSLSCQWPLREKSSSYLPFTCSILYLKKKSPAWCHRGQFGDNSPDQVLVSPSDTMLSLSCFGPITITWLVH